MFFVQKGNAEDTLSRQTPSPAMQVALFLLTKISSKKRCQECRDPNRLTGILV